MYQEPLAHASTNQMLLANSKNRPSSMTFDQWKLLQKKRVITQKIDVIVIKIYMTSTLTFIEHFIVILLLFNTYSPQVSVSWFASHEYFRCQENEI